MARKRRRQKALSPAPSRGWRILESYLGAWQQDVEVKRDSVLAFHADFACRTLIASDIAKLGLRLVKKDKDGIWTEAPRQPAILRKPNHFQNRIQFIESWVLSKLQAGNTYALKRRDGKGKVDALYILDPNLVTPLVADSGDIFYELNTDSLAGLPQQVVVPASEIIHDRFNTFFHPLVGLSPIFAGGLAAMQGLTIQKDSTVFFQNGARPSGILTGPGNISDTDEQRLAKSWNENFSGKNSGKIAVLGSGLKFEVMSSKAVDAQLIEQLRWTTTVVCSVYHVPPYKIGIGEAPKYATSSVQSLNIDYFETCLQILIEAIEACLDEGLDYNGVSIGTEIDVDGLLRMDTATQFDVVQKSKGTTTLNEARRRVNLVPVEGGDTIYLQQQDHSLAAIAARDAALIAGEPEPEPDMTVQTNAALVEIFKGLR
ncbi:HK97 family phage portal protein [Rhizobium sp. BK316]|uniref:phage portal protein n=1 Tax=Rhizobium sp. BK316 TaxID=2587053 RepID=UPI001611FAC4|nr:phage portal protein [Rhizobium sp. BK316]MBB3410667.1 HK97 family phage portal protein [Rhizobium sp. BK316]